MPLKRGPWTYFKRLRQKSPVGGVRHTCRLSERDQKRMYPILRSQDVASTSTPSNKGVAQLPVKRETGKRPEASGGFHGNHVSDKRTTAKFPCPVPLLREFTAQINHVRWPWLKSTSKFDRDLMNFLCVLIEVLFSSFDHPSKQWKSSPLKII